MKAVKYLLFALLLASVLAAGCTSPSATPSPTPTPTASPTTVITSTPGPSYLPPSQVYMPKETTNGRTYPSTVPAPSNGSKPDQQMTGELGRE